MAGRTLAETLFWNLEFLSARYINEKEWRLFDIAYDQILNVLWLFILSLYLEIGELTLVSVLKRQD